jgi:hypothetical protein
MFASNQLWCCLQRQKYECKACRYRVLWIQRANSTCVEGLDGIKADESVGDMGDFLVNSQSKLKAAVGGFPKIAVKASASLRRPIEIDLIRQ